MGIIFFYDFNAFYEQRLNSIFSVDAIRTVKDYFIIVTHTLHLSAKKNIIMCFTDKRLLSQVRFLFTYELSTSGIVVLCSNRKFINVSHEKIDIKIELLFAVLC